MGNWFEAEVTLNKLLTRNVVDVEARLMLATLLRHTGRFQEAGEQLGRLSRMDGAERWQMEITRQRTRLAMQTRESAEASKAAVSDKSADDAADDSTDEERLSHAA
jgi:cytochrome c-type biogenesis protein CcmH/NrfG